MERLELLNRYRKCRTRQELLEDSMEDAITALLARDGKAAVGIREVVIAVCIEKGWKLPGTPEKEENQEHEQR